MYRCDALVIRTSWAVPAGLPSQSPPGRKPGAKERCWATIIAVNLAVCLIILPIRVFVVAAKRNGYHIQLDTCKHMTPLFLMLLLVVHWCEASLALNRCVALYFPHYYRNWCSRIVNLLVIVGVWVVAVLVVCPFSARLHGCKAYPLTIRLCLMWPRELYGHFFQVYAQLSALLHHGLWRNPDCGEKHRAATEATSGWAARTGWGQERPSATATSRCHAHAAVEVPHHAGVYGAVIHLRQFISVPLCDKSAGIL